MTNGDYPQILSDFSVFDMLKVRAEPAGSISKKIRRNSRVSKGISAQASHRTVREPLNSYGSCYPSCFYSQTPMIEQIRIG